MGAQPLRFAVVETFDGGEVIGPDAAGYVMVTHAPQTFVDISKTGVFTNPADDGAFNITTTFPISVYGKSSNMVRVGNNGAMLFGTLTGTVSFANSAMQTSANYFIAPLWDDFSTEQGGVVWQELGNAPNRMLVVQWQNRPRYKAIGGATFQVQLRETGEIIFAYKNVDFGNTFFDKGANATVGIRGANSGQALQYSFNSPKLQNNTTICITSNVASCADVQWVTAIPGQVGSLLGTPASSLPVAVLLDSAKSGFGTHTMTLTLVNNSTSALINVPVILTVPLMQPAVLRYFPIIAR